MVPKPNASGDGQLRTTASKEVIDCDDEQRISRGIRYLEIL